jgi:3-phosphoshikimate 1-carboxyvinyltransferase
VKPLPDILEIQPLTKPPNCTITVPGSKSITNRALILAALSDGKCTLRGALWADDTQVMVDSLQKLGFEVTVEPDPAEECNRTITLVGRSGEIPAKKAELYVGNAGTAARFLTALVCLGHGEYRIDGDARMRERPMKELFETLERLGAEIESSQNQLPATIRAKGLRENEVVNILLTDSTQFASALVLIQGRGGFGLSHLNVEVQDPGFILMTEAMCNEFRSPQFSGEYTIEPDMSSASYFIAVDRLAEGRISIAHWPKDSLQIDGRFQDFFPPPPKISRTRDLGDSVMTLAICALFGKQQMRLVHAGRLRVQETDRIKAMVTELRKVGGKRAAEETDDGFIVNPVPMEELHGADIETYNDHRMAMCFSVLGLKVPGIRIKNPSCVSKTFPNFFDKLEQLRT